MTITRQIVADQIAAYLQHRLSLAAIVDWAEQQIVDADFESPAVRDVVARLGLADVRTFGLTWEDSERFLRELGFATHVQVAATSAK